MDPILCVLFMSDIPTLESTTIATFADDTAILALGKTQEEATRRLQLAVDEVAKWMNS